LRHSPPDHSGSLGQSFFLILTNMCQISYKFVKKESFQIFTNICEPILAFSTSIH
jgi:hypothetical protein